MTDSTPVTAARRTPQDAWQVGLPETGNMRDRHPAFGRITRDILDGLDEGYRLLGPVGFVSAAVLFVLVLAVLAHA